MCRRHRQGRSLLQEGLQPRCSCDRTTMTGHVDTRCRATQEPPMKFLCLCHYDAVKFADCSAEDFQKIAAICAPHDAALHSSGHLVAVGSLTAPSTYAVIRPGDDGPTVELAPYVQTDEPFGAFFILE